MSKTIKCVHEELVIVNFPAKILSMNILRTAALLAFMTALFMLIGGMLGGFTGALIALAIAITTNFWAFWTSDKAVLRRYQAIPIDGGDVYDLTAKLATNAGLPMPTLYVIESEQPNAFATGRNPQNAAVALNSGIVKILTPEELGGVIAHELAHIDNRDILTMSITATLAGAISMLGQFSLFAGRGNQRTNPLIAIGAAMLAPFAAMLVQMAISRTREYSADKRGAQICGNPKALASALKKIHNAAHQIPNQRAENNPATAHMFIINPLRGTKRDNLFATHPNTQNRIDALNQMAAQQK